MADTATHNPQMQFLTTLAIALGSLAIALVLLTGSVLADSADDGLKHQLLLAEPVLLLDSANERSNFCAGGLEDGKIIVNEAFMRNGFKETTVLGCQVDGGRAVQMPDLPDPNARATRLS